MASPVTRSSSGRCGLPRSQRSGRRVMVVALLWTCALGATCDAAAAGPVAAVPAAPAPAQATTQPRPRAYLFRGFAGWIFSLGTDRLAERIERAGFTANVSEAVMCSSVASEAIRDYRAAPAPITLIGHSVGGACALSFAQTLAAENIPVSLVVTTDPAKITGDVPLNVARYINIFQSNSMLGGRNVVPMKGYRGHYASFDLIEHTELNHTNLKKAEAIHEQIVAKMQEFAAAPAPAEGDPAPLRLVVPADAALELWDSGAPVVARPGDTLQTLATFYQVPLWSLTELNATAEAAPLSAGQRIIVPRHLLPSAEPITGAVSSRAPAKR